MLKLIAMGLSKNPSATKSADGKFNVTSDGALYVVASFIDPENPFSGIKMRTIRQQQTDDGSFVWKIDLNTIKAAIGRTIKGEIITRECEPYEIGERTVTSYTTVVFANENVATVFKSAKHPVVGTTETASVVEATAEQPVAVEDF